MNVTQQSTILLIKSAISGQPETLPEEMDFAQVAKFMKKQGLIAVCYLGALNCGIPEEDPTMQELQDMYCVSLISSENQLALIQSITDAFAENGIDHMPVKGTLMKPLYPDHAMRYMCDADILIREEQYPKIRPIMEQLGFVEKGESDHEHIWKQHYLMVELHKHLIPSYNKDYYSYFGVGWDLAKVQDGCRFAMTKEDAFIYDTIHFAKHYRDATASSKFIMDIWIYLRTYPELDHTYIRHQLSRLRMESFYDNILRVTRAWFEDGQWDEIVERISCSLFNDDTEQKLEAIEIAKKTKEAHNAGSAQKARRNRILHRIFPTREQINVSDPQLKRVPLLFAWVARWWLRANKIGKAFHEEKEINEKINEQVMACYRQDLEYVGLQFSDSVALPD